MKYSKKYTRVSGIMYLSSDGTYLIFAFRPINGFSSSLSSSELSISSALPFNSFSFSVLMLASVVLMVLLEPVDRFGSIFGRRSTPQKATASIAGTTIIISIVVTGVTPNAMSPAYEREPMTPAPPVPDDHVDITFL